MCLFKLNKKYLKMFFQISISFAHISVKLIGRKLQYQESDWLTFMSFKKKPIKLRHFAYCKEYPLPHVD